MWNHKRTRQRRAGIFILLLGVGTSAAATIAWHFGIAPDFFAACAVSCFVFCVPLLFGPVDNTPRIDVDCGPREIAEACQVLGPSACQIDWITEGLRGEMDQGEIGGDFAGGGFDCDFDLPFF